MFTPSEKLFPRHLRCPFFKIDTLSITWEDSELGHHGEKKKWSLGKHMWLIFL
jgi:hypothetical protein